MQDGVAGFIRCTLLDHAWYSKLPSIMIDTARDVSAIAGLSEEVAQAIFESVLPRAAGDALPQSAPGAPVLMLSACFSQAAKNSQVAVTSHAAASPAAND